MDLLGLASDLSLLNADCGAQQRDIDDLKRYINEARCLIHSLNPQYYAEIKTIKLGAGSVQTVCECDTITEVLGQTDKPCGGEVTESKFPQQWGAKCGTSKFEHTLIKTRISTNTLVVTPPVPEGVDVYLTIKCTASDRMNASDEADLGACKDGVALSAYAMYRATLRDSDGDPAMLNLAAAHLRLFAEISGLQYRILKAEVQRIDEAQTDG